VGLVATSAAERRILSSVRPASPPSFAAPSGAALSSPRPAWRVLRRHGLCTRAKRLGLIAGHACPPDPLPREEEPALLPAGRSLSEHWCSRLAERVASELAERGSVGSGRPRPFFVDLYQNGLHSPGTRMVAISRWVREPSQRSVS
jgi:hypothetical protein